VTLLLRLCLSKVVFILQPLPPSSNDHRMEASYCYQFLHYFSWNTGMVRLPLTPSWVGVERGCFEKQAE
jgi:hypothetical protein